MNESKQPFTDLVTRSQSASKMSRLGWLAAVVMAMLALFFLMLWSSTRTGHRKEIDSLQTRLDGAKSQLLNALAEKQTNQDTITTLKGQVADLEAQKDMAAQMSKALENEMRSDLESKDVTISNLKGKLTVNIVDRVMFDSGEAILKPDGEAVMRKIAAILVEHPQLKIQVIGHTDNVPIRPAARSRFASNWELSTARALAAVHFLTEQAGIDPRRVGAVGYGEFRPIADNATAEGRAKNRRIAVTIVPDELAGIDIMPAIKAGGDANSTPNTTNAASSMLPDR
jgi:chemotaxis protein MotB